MMMMSTSMMMTLVGLVVVVQSADIEVTWSETDGTSYNWDGDVETSTACQGSNAPDIDINTSDQLLGDISGSNHELILCDFSASPDVLETLKHGTKTMIDFDCASSTHFDCVGTGFQKLKVLSGTSATNCIIIDINGGTQLSSGPYAGQWTNIPVNDHTCNSKRRLKAKDDDEDDDEEDMFQ